MGVGTEYSLCLGTLIQLLAPLCPMFASELWCAFAAAPASIAPTAHAHPPSADVTSFDLVCPRPFPLLSPPLFPFLYFISRFSVASRIKLFHTLQQIFHCIFHFPVRYTTFFILEQDTARTTVANYTPSSYSPGPHSGIANCNYTVLVARLNSCVK